MAAAAGRVARVDAAMQAQARVAAAWATAEPAKRVVTAVRAAVAAVREKRRVKERERGAWVPGSVEAVWTIWARPPWGREERDGRGGWGTKR